MRCTVVLCLVAVLMAGCAGGTGERRGVSEQAVSQQTSTSDKQKRARIHTELGALYLESGRHGVAQDEARTAVTSDPDYAPAYNLLGLVHMALQEREAAEEAFRRALRLAPNDPEINNNFGWFLCQTEREKQAIDHFMAAVKNPLYTTPGKPLTNLGLCYLRLRDDKLAEDFLLKALRVDKNNIQAFYSLGDICYRQGRYGEARANVGELHKLMEPTALSLWLALRIERKIGDREGEMRQAVQLRRKFQGSPEYQRMMQGQYD